MESNKSVVIVVGAGSTYSDGENDSRTYMRPPVDRGFFRESNKDPSVAKILGGVRASLMDFYDMDPLEENNDSLEGVLVKVYADMMSIGSVDRESREKLFMDLGYLLNMRMATTTNFFGEQCHFEYQEGSSPGIWTHLSPRKTSASSHSTTICTLRKILMSWMDSKCTGRTREKFSIFPICTN